jgi:hypothetical protein
MKKLIFILSLILIVINAHAQSGVNGNSDWHVPILTPTIPQVSPIATTSINAPNTIISTVVSVPVMPSIPTMPAVSAVPGVSLLPSTPAVPNLPAVPSVPVQSVGISVQVSSLPSLPALPPVPAVPPIPELRLIIR